MARVATQVMLARRPKAIGQSAFGHVDLDRKSRTQVESVLQSLVKTTTSRTEVAFHPDDIAAEGEVLTAPLKGFDSHFQPNAVWSLERAVEELLNAGSPTTLANASIAAGGWTFYLLHSKINNKDAVAVRARSPSWGLDANSKILTKLVGDELKLVDEPLLAFDHSADALVVSDKVFVLRPRPLETLLVDADAVKGRADETVKSFSSRLGASLPTGTLDSLQRVCSHNANVARRVERLTRDTDLSRVTAKEVRAALPDAGLPADAFGSSGPLRAGTDRLATTLVDIAADLYYQPRFADAPRRVAAYRRLT